jgi:hypothetical protein
MKIGDKIRIVREDGSSSILTLIKRRETLIAQPWGIGYRVGDQEEFTMEEINYMIGHGIMKIELVSDDQERDSKKI